MRLEFLRNCFGQAVCVGPEDDIISAILLSLFFSVDIYTFNNTLRITIAVSFFLECVRRGLGMLQIVLGSLRNYVGRDGEIRVNEGICSFFVNFRIKI